jgi:hypothetical protein
LVWGKHGGWEEKAGPRSRFYEVVSIFKLIVEKKYVVSARDVNKLNRRVLKVNNSIETPAKIFGSEFANTYACLAVASPVIGI